MAIGFDPSTAILALNDKDESFDEWKLKNAPEDTGEDYDLAGAFNANLHPAENGHFPDTFKKPNHPTFSKESIYSTDDQAGGEWSKDEQGKDTFKPSAWMGSDPARQEGLRSYFKEKEPNATLIDPDPYVAPFDPSTAIPREEHINNLVNDPTFDPARHKDLGVSKEDAFEVRQKKKDRTLVEKTKAFASGISGSTFAEAAKGVAKFIGGLAAMTGEGIVQTVGPTVSTVLKGLGYNALAKNVDNELLSQRRELALGASHGEEAVKSLGRNIGEFSGDISHWASGGPRDNAKEMEDFDADIAAADREKQLQEGKFIEGSVVSKIAKAGSNMFGEGKDIESTLGAKHLEEEGARKANELTVEMLSAGMDPVNIALMASSLVTGGATSIAGKAATALAKAGVSGRVAASVIRAGMATASGVAYIPKLIANTATSTLGAAASFPFKVIRAIPSRLGRITRIGETGLTAGLAVEAAMHPALVAKAAGIAATAKFLGILGEGLSAAGKTGATALDQKILTGSTLGQRNLLLKGSRALGEGVHKFIEVPIEFAPFNLASSGGDPNKFADMSVGAGMFGGIFAAKAHFRRSIQKGLNVRAHEALMVVDGERNYTDINSDIFAFHQGNLMRFDEGTQREIKKARHFANGMGTDIIVLSPEQADYINANKAKFNFDIPSEFKKSSAAHISSDGRILINTGTLGILDGKAGFFGGGMQNQAHLHEIGHAVLDTIGKSIETTHGQQVVKILDSALTKEEFEAAGLAYVKSLHKEVGPAQEAALRQLKDNPLIHKDEILSEISRSLLRGQDLASYGFSQESNRIITSKFGKTMHDIMRALGMGLTQMDFGAYDTKVDISGKMGPQFGQIWNQELAKAYNTLLHEYGQRATRKMRGTLTDADRDFYQKLKEKPPIPPKDVAEEVTPEVTPEKIGHLTPKEVLDAHKSDPSDPIGAVIDAHKAKSEEDNKGGLTVEVHNEGDPKEFRTVDGVLIKDDPFSEYILDQVLVGTERRPLTQEERDIITGVKTGSVNGFVYGHAGTVENPVINAARRREQILNPAKARIEDEALQQKEQKRALFVNAVFNEKTREITLQMLSVDKLNNNYKNLVESINIANGRGANIVNPYTSEAEVVADLKSYAENYKNNYLGDGAGVAKDANGVPLVPSGTPIPIERSKFDFINLLLANESAKNETPLGLARRRIAEANGIDLGADRESNPLRGQLNAVLGPKWSSRTLESPHEILRPELISEINGDITSVGGLRNVGPEFNEAFDRGIPDENMVAGNYMPAEVTFEPSKEWNYEDEPYDSQKYNWIRMLGVKVPTKDGNFDEAHKLAENANNWAIGKTLMNAAAKIAGFDPEKPLFHNGRIWTVADVEKTELGIHMGTRGQAADVAQKNSFRQNGDYETKDLLNNIKNPLRLFDTKAEWTVARLLPQLEKAGIKITENVIDSHSQKLSNPIIQKAIKDAGYDGIVYYNEVEGLQKHSMKKESGEYGFQGESWMRSPEENARLQEIASRHGGADSMIAFDADQIKLDEPFTYDDNNELIPLSKRFSKSEDVRYMPEDGSLNSEEITLGDNNVSYMPSDKKAKEKKPKEKTEWKAGEDSLMEYEGEREQIAAVLADRFTNGLDNPSLLGPLKKLIGKYPAYLNGPLDHIVKSAVRLKLGKITHRELAKAYIMTIVSQGAGAVSLEALQKSLVNYNEKMKREKKPQIKFKINPSKIFLHTNKKGKIDVRPEEIAAYWITTKDGKKALDNLDYYAEGLTPTGRQPIKGSTKEATMPAKYRPEDFAIVKLLREFYGDDRVAGSGMMIGNEWAEGQETIRESRPSWEKEPFPSKASRRDAYGYKIQAKNEDGTPKLDWSEKKIGEVTLSNLSDALLEINKNKGNDVQGMIDIFLKFKGIDSAKAPFIGHFIGFGQRVTLDAVEKNYEIGETGDSRNFAKDRQEAPYKAKKNPTEDEKKEIAKIRAEIKAKNDAVKLPFRKELEVLSGSSELQDLARTFIENKIDQIREERLAKNPNDPIGKIPNEAFFHIMHHWIWDAAKGIKTTHKGLYKSMDPKYMPSEEGSKNMELARKMQDELASKIPEFSPKEIKESIIYEYDDPPRGGYFSDSAQEKIDKLSEERQDAVFWWFNNHLKEYLALDNGVKINNLNFDKDSKIKLTDYDSWQILDKLQPNRGEVPKTERITSGFVNGNTLSENDLYSIQENYSKWARRSGMTPTDLIQHIGNGNASVWSAYGTNDKFVGQFIGDTFVVSHFAPEGGKSAIEGLMDLLHTQTPVVFAVPDRIAGQLERLGFRRSKLVIPMMFKGEVMQKNLLANNAVTGNDTQKLAAWWVAESSLNGLLDKIGSSDLLDSAKEGINQLQLNSKDASYMPSEKSSRYLELAKDPETNRKELQGIVDETAKNAGNLNLYHGNTSEFGKFSYNDLGIHLGDKNSAKERLDQTGQNNGIVKNYFVNIKNPIRLRYDPDMWDAYDVAKSLPKESLKKIEENYDILNITNLELKQELKDQGFDGISYGNAFEGGESFLVFDPSQIKSTDPVTYDVNGKVIPIEERFNLKSDKISYMPFAGEGATGFAEAEKRGDVFVNPFDFMKRFEISDDKMKSKDAWQKLTDSTASSKITIGDLYDHEELFKSYPWLRDVPVIKDPNLDSLGSAREDNRIKIGGQFLEDIYAAIDKNPFGNISIADYYLKKTIIHEIQHLIQFKEKFPRGADTSEKFLLQRLNDIEKSKIRQINRAEEKFDAIPYNDLNKLKAKKIDQDLIILKEDLSKWQEYYFDKYFYKNGKFTKSLSRQQLFDLYFSAAGEMEARMASDRSEFSDDHRKQNPAIYQNQEHPFVNFHRKFPYPQWDAIYDAKMADANAQKLGVDRYMPADELADQLGVSGTLPDDMVGKGLSTWMHDLIEAFTKAEKDGNNAKAEEIREYLSSGGAGYALVNKGTGVCWASNYGAVKNLAGMLRSRGTPFRDEIGGDEYCYVAPYTMKGDALVSNVEYANQRIIDIRNWAKTQTPEEVKRFEARVQNWAAKNGQFLYSNFNIKDAKFEKIAGETSESGSFEARKRLMQYLSSEAISKEFNLPSGQYRAYKSIDPAYHGLVDDMETTGAMFHTIILKVNLTKLEKATAVQDYRNYQNSVKEGSKKSGSAEEKLIILDLVDKGIDVNKTKFVQDYRDYQEAVMSKKKKSGSKEEQQIIKNLLLGGVDESVIAKEKGSKAEEYGVDSHPSYDSIINGDVVAYLRNPVAAKTLRPTVFKNFDKYNEDLKKKGYAEPVAYAGLETNYPLRGDMDDVKNVLVISNAKERAAARQHNAKVKINGGKLKEIPKIKWKYSEKLAPTPNQILTQELVDKANALQEAFRTGNKEDPDQAFNEYARKSEAYRNANEKKYKKFESGDKQFEQIKAAFAYVRSKITKADKVNKDIKAYNDARKKGTQEKEYVYPLEYEKLQNEAQTLSRAISLYESTIQRKKEKNREEKKLAKKSGRDPILVPETATASKWALRSLKIAGERDLTRNERQTQYLIEDEEIRLREKAKKEADEKAESEANKANKKPKAKKSKIQENAEARIEAKS